MSDDALRDSCLTQLTASLKALASEPSDQLALFPDSISRADDLASRFDDARAVFSEYESSLSRPQLDALAALGERLATISRDGAEFDPGLWTDEAVRASVHWRDVRALAKAALDAFERVT
ncbi:MAG TPA: hypothetical protein VKB50_13440 [Vicinamibacterales bacterium]|nr:hypothetical protein [Vicinamibacterales bacterium]